MPEKVRKDLLLQGEREGETRHKNGPPLQNHLPTKQDASIVLPPFHIFGDETSISVINLNQFRPSGALAFSVNRR
jgi:hypothetical protein